LLIKCVWEHNGNDSLIFADHFIGAFTRGANQKEALSKFQQEISSYLAWKTGERSCSQVETEIIQEKSSGLRIADADSDILFDSEIPALTWDEYRALKALAMKSAGDFQKLYASVPNKEKPLLPGRKTFYGDVPVTAQQMYDHTKGVNPYYFGEIGVDADQGGTIATCRKCAFERLEGRAGFLDNSIFEGGYNERWTLRKVCRRFVWHDRIHAKALYRAALKTFGAECIPDIFHFQS